MLFPDAGIEVSSLIHGRDAPRGAPPGEACKAQKQEFRPVPPGSYNAAAIILLTDGQRSTGPDSLEAAKMAGDRGVRVFTVGIGTTSGETIGFEGWSMRVRLDEETLKQIANMTRADYFYAGTAADLKKVYETLHSRLVLGKKETEITALFAAAGAALALVSALPSLAWFSRILSLRPSEPGASAESRGRGESSPGSLPTRSQAMPRHFRSRRWRTTFCPPW